jgi:YidC/Oxa1 family membrane protein insertase
MSSEKRVLVAFVLSFAMLMLWQAFLVKKPPHPPAPAKSAISPQPKKPAANEAKTTKSAKAAPAKRPEPIQLPVVEGSQAQDIVVENDLYKVTFSTQGGVVKSWILRNYKDAHGRPLDVVNAAACDEMGYPMSLSMADPALAQKLNQAIYVAKPAASSLHSPATLEFDYSNGKVRVEKKFSFGSDYQIHAAVSVFDGERDLPVEVAWPGGFGDHSVGIQMEEASSEAFYDSGGKLESVAQHKMKQEQTIPGPLSFAGVEDRYFAGVFFPGSPEQTFRFERKSWTPKEWKEKEPPTALVAALGSDAARPLDFRLFVAPKDLNVLRSTNPPTEELVDFGWFTVIAKPLLVALIYVYNHWIHNYGWAIVILTIILNMALFPLKVKQIRSAQEMQRVAPLVKAIQDRYKQYKFNDPRKQRMNQEVMKLYQEHHVNPLGGCLPMLPQIPLLYAFYRVLEVPIELRHAPWMLWIKDLSLPDPSHILGLPIPILPTIMVISLFAVQKMTPMPTADPSQQKMMMFMPIFMGLLFFRLASGLVLYFLAANVVGIAQQLLINRYYAPKSPPPAGSQKPAALAKA